MDTQVAVMAAICLLVLAALGCMGLHMKMVEQPRRTKQLRASAPQRRMDKLA